MLATPPAPPVPPVQQPNNRQAQQYQQYPVYQQPHQVVKCPPLIVLLVNSNYSYLLFFSIKHQLIATKCLMNTITVATAAIIMVAVTADMRFTKVSSSFNTKTWNAVSVFSSSNWGCFIKSIQVLT